MISNTTKRSILRCIHLIFSIPIIGYVYSPFAELPNYAPVVRFVSIPVLILSGFWMYAGVFFAIIGVALWLGAYYLSGYGGYPESGRAIHRAEDLVGDSCATFKKIGPTRCCR
jgi:membrane protein implicated in regulation of membrane protease activity